VALLLVLVVGGFHYVDLSAARESRAASERARVDLGAADISREFEVVTADLRFLAASSALRRYLDDGDEEARSELARDFLALSRSSGLYDQIRLLDRAGMERLRVNFNGGDPAVVPQAQLQDKSRRYYFEDSIRLERGGVFVSPLDLNIERGRVERPLKPMIRFGMPVFDGAGRKRGVLLLNYLALRLTDRIREVLASSVSEPWMLNADGYWLLAPDPADAWGFMLDHGRSFAAAFPRAWTALRAPDQGQILTDEGLFTFTAVFPMLEGQVSSTGAAEADTPSASEVGMRGYRWQVGTRITPATRARLVHKHLVSGALQLGILLGLALIASLAGARAWVRGRHASTALRDSEKRLRSITRDLAEGLLVTDLEGRVSMTNPEAERLLGWSEKELCGRDLHGLIHFRKDGTPVPPELCAARRALSDENVHRVDDEYFARRDGGLIPVAYTAAPLQSGDTLIGAIVSFQDISERRRMQAELERLATRDPLTGVYNRRELERRLAQEVARADRYRVPLSVLMLDLDRFKELNDSYGHQVGDATLKTVASRIAAIVRTTDQLARYGGEEFLVIMPHTDVAAALELAERIRRRVADEPVEAPDGASPRVTLSIGVAALSGTERTPEELLRSADAALYEAKKAGRNRVVCREPDSP
jgi:diguanylate cyclase (GGDEF)-like protein/PAS domain S-box-containing protein